MKIVVLTKGPLYLSPDKTPSILRSCEEWFVLYYSSNIRTVDGQIIHMKDKGITFNIIDEEDAKDFLLYNNYYFKIKSYAKNYDKYRQDENEGKYINLDFAYLKELSTLDMHLRQFVMKVTLSIEHFLKTQMLRDFMYSDSEDGYSIIEDFFID